MRCSDCGAELRSKESIKRHRGSKCQMAYLERRVANLEAQVRTLTIVVRGLKESKQG